jgi:acyl-CoA thioester hydrolase
MQSKIQFRVRYQETDRMGIVHHSVYLIWFEAGRTEWMREHQLTYRECEAKGWLLPLVESGCKYLSPAAYDDLVEVETVMIPKSGAEFQFEYTVRNVETGKVLVTGFTKHVCVNRDYKIDKQGTKALKEFFTNILEKQDICLG